MDTYSQELTEYLQSLIRAIKRGVDGSGFDVEEPIVLDLALVNSKRIDGGFDIFVVKGKKKYRDEQLSKLRIKIKKKQME